LSASCLRFIHRVTFSFPQVPVLFHYRGSFRPVVSLVPRPRSNGEGFAFSRTFRFYRGRIFSCKFLVGPGRCVLCRVCPGFGSPLRSLVPGTIVFPVWRTNVFPRRVLHFFFFSFVTVAVVLSFFRQFPPYDFAGSSAPLFVDLVHELLGVPKIPWSSIFLISLPYSFFRGPLDCSIFCIVGGCSSQHTARAMREPRGRS